MTPRAARILQDVGVNKGFTGVFIISDECAAASSFRRVSRSSTVVSFMPRLVPGNDARPRETPTGGDGRSSWWVTITCLKCMVDI